MSLARAAIRTLTRWGSPVVECVFPCTCWATGTPIARADLGLSPDTRLAIARAIAWPYCTRCGSTTGPFTTHGAANPCPRCATRNLGVAHLARAGTFDPPLSILVKKLKFERHPEVAAVLAPFIYQAITLQQRAVDVLIPVPLHWRRKLARGYNQSEELARAVARLSHWPMHNVLRRIKRTPEQSHTQSRLQRIDNLRGAFACRPTTALAGKHVWLIDDVCTTGATLHAAAMAFRRLPKAHRPASINAGVACVTDWTPVPQEGAPER